MKNTQKITLDLDGRNYSQCITAKQGDRGTRYIECAFVAGGKSVAIPTTATAVYAMTKPDKTTVYNSATIQDGKVMIALSDQSLTVAGLCRCEVQIKDDGILSSATFGIDVRQSAYDDSLPPSADEYGALLDTIARYDALEDEFKVQIARVNDVISALKDGALESSAETIMLRTDVDGNTFNTAADRVDALQIESRDAIQSINNHASDIEKDLTDLENFVDDNTVNGLRYDEQTSMLYLTRDGNVIPGIDPVKIVSGAGGLTFSSWAYDQDTMYLHLYDDEGSDVIDPVYIPGGGGGGTSGSKLTFAMTSATTFSVSDTSGSAPVSFKFLSTDASSGIETGGGTLMIYVGGTLKRSLTIQQGDNTINVFDYLAIGSNTVKLVLTDSYGASATRTCYITRETLTLAWNLESTLRNSGDLTVNLTPTGTGTKTLVLKLDGAVYSSDTVTSSGRRITKTITGLAHGGHVLEAYCTLDIDGTTLSSEVLTAAIAQVQDGINIPVIACGFTADTVAQYDTLAIDHRVIDPSNNPANVQYIVNGTTYATAQIDQSSQVWSYRPINAGRMTIEIVCGATRWTHTLMVTALEKPVEEVTENLKLKLDPAAITSLSGWNYNGITLSLSNNFDTVNGGLQTDSDGARGLRIMKGDRVTVNYKLFADDAKKTGKEIKVIYRVENCSDFDTVALSCINSGIGLQIKANACILTSEQTVLEMQTCEDMRTELDINIEPDRNDRLMTYWEDGSHAGITTYAESDNFTQNSPVNITIGSDDCNIWVYLLRCYSSDLSDSEIRANYIADGANNSIITKRQTDSQIYDSAGNIDPDRCAEICPDAHVMTWHGTSISTAKTNKVPGYLTHKYVSGGAQHTWTAYNAIDKVQGTSSAAYVLAGLNHDFEAVEGFVLEDGTKIDKYAMTNNSIPVDYFNFKLNVASSENINNILISEWYNRYQRYIRPAKVADARVRDCIEGHMAVLFYHNTGTTPVQAGAVTVMPDETILYGIGTLNNSKKNYEVFGQTEQYDDDTIVIELLNNTSDQNRFKSDDLSGETWDGNGSYEFRYLSDTVTQTQAAALWQSALSFVVSCDPDAATNGALNSTVTYNGVTYNYDTKDYRLAKYKAEVDKHFVLDSVLYHQLFTLVFCLPDNRAKNTFWGYSKKLGKWHLNFSYDHDTAMGNDNEGGLTLRYGYLDTDHIGTRAVFNASDSVIFALNREVFADKLKDMFIELENAGCWDFEQFGALCEQYQSAICPALWAEDSVKKYITPLTNSGSSAYLPMLNGKKRLQRAQFLMFQRQFMSSYFVGTYCTSNTGTIRGYTPTSYKGVTPASKMTITPYCDMFVTVKAGSTTTQVRAYAGVPVEIDLGVTRMNDTEIYPYNAPFIQDIGELACLYPGYCDLAAFKRLKYVRIGSDAKGYANTNLTEVSVTNCTALEALDVENCPQLKQALDLTNNLMLKQLKTKGSGVTGVTFAPAGRLAEASLNAITSLTVKQLRYLQELTLEDYDNLTTLIVEDSPAVNSLQIVQASANLARIRLLKVAWNIETSTLLIRMSKIGGIDDDGYNTNSAVLTGACHVEGISQSRLATVKAVFPVLTVTYDTLLADHTVTFVLEDGSVWDTQIVEHGSDAVKPATDPTKESSIDKVYTFAGWGGSYSNITQDTTVTAIFSETTRTYTVRFYNGETLVQTSIVDCYGNCDYTGTDLVKDGYLWTGWDASTRSVSSDMDVHAVFDAVMLPSAPADMDNFDYLYSDDPSDSSAYTLGELCAICDAGLGSTYMQVGDQLKITLVDNAAISDEYIIFVVYGFNHFKRDDSGFANVVFGMLGTLNAASPINTANSNTGGWPGTTMRKWLNDTVMYSLPCAWRHVIKPVQVLSSAGDTTAVIVTSLDKLFLFSAAEVGLLSTEVPYTNEIDADAECKTFTLFTNNNSRIKKTFNGTGTALNWWLRSPDASTTTSFRLAASNGGVSTTFSGSVHGVVFGFCI